MDTRAIRLAAGLAAALPGAASSASAKDIPVDVELVLAVDVSWSMNAEEQRIQRDGYVAAFRSAEVQRAILQGGHGKVAVAYVEWAGAFSQSVVIPFTMIDSREAADGFAYLLAAGRPARERRTSIAAVIDFAAPMFDGNGYAGLRRVIDVSGDGPNNQGRAVTEARDAAAARGVTINGLPLMTSGLSSGYGGWGSIAHLDRYYADCVVGGPGAFVIPVDDWAQFPDAVRRKLVLELAGWPEPDAAVPVVPVQTEPTSDCFIGERMWEEMQGR